MKILLPIDVTNICDSLVADLKLNLTLENTSIDLLYIIEQLPAYENVIDTFSGIGENLHEKIYTHAQEVLSKLKSQLTNSCQSVNFKILFGLISPTIHDEIVKNNYDLVIIPSYDPVKLEEYVFGRVSRHIINTNPTQSLILKPSPASPIAKNVIIGIDGSPDSLKAISKAQEIFNLKTNYQTIYLVNVVHLQKALYAFTPPEFSSMVQGNMVMQSDVYLAQAQKAINDLAIHHVEPIQKTGDPATEIASLAKELNSSLVIVASHGSHAFPKLILGSVSKNVAKLAKTQIAILK